MADLDTLRPEVRRAIESLDVRADEDWTEYHVIRAELLRLADENKRMRGIIETLDVEGHRRAEKAEAELAALKARIECADAGIVHRCAGCKATHVGASKDMIGKRILLLVDEPQGDNAKEGRSRE